MKLIFLDIDGVANSSTYFNSEKFRKEFNNVEDDKVKIDPSSIKLVNQLVDESGSLVILSSAWRIHHSLEEMNLLLKQRGATFTLSDFTPVKYTLYNYVPRGKEVQLYLDSLYIKPTHFVILDDNSDMLHLSHYLVQTNPKVGITKLDIEKALKILEG